MFHYLPKKTTFLPYSISNWDDIVEVKRSKRKKIKIVHSPTSRDFKGSKYILDALNILQDKYAHVEVSIIENLPHTQALELYKESDLVIDQVLIGWYGAFGVEVMKMGKPLAVYIREDDLKFIPLDMAQDLMETVINITPFNIVEKLSLYIENENLLEDKAKAGLEYSNKWHNPMYVAGIVQSVYES